MSPLRGLMTRRERFRGFHPRLSAAAAARPMTNDDRRHPREMADTFYYQGATSIPGLPTVHG